MVGGGSVAKSCLTLATPRTVPRQAPLYLGIHPGKNTGLGRYFLLQDREIQEYTLLKNKYTPIRHKGENLRECQTKSLDRARTQTVAAPCRPARWPPEGAMEAKWGPCLSRGSPDCYSIYSSGFNNPRARWGGSNTLPHCHLGLSQSEEANATIGASTPVFTCL